MNTDYKILNNRLITSDFEIDFAFDIGQVGLWSGIYVVRLSIPIPVCAYNNVYGVNSKGEIVWQIQDPVSAFKITKSTQGYLYYIENIYEAINQGQNETFLAYTHKSMEYIVDCRTGKLLDVHGVGQRPW